MISIRSFKNTDIEKMNKMVQGCPCWILEMCPTISRKYEVFAKIIHLVLDKHAPLRTMRVRKCRPKVR